MLICTQLVISVSYLHPFMGKICFQASWENLEQQLSRDTGYGVCMAPKQIPSLSAKSQFVAESILTEMWMFAHICLMSLAKRLASDKSKGSQWLSERAPLPSGAQLSYKTLRWMRLTVIVSSDHTRNPCIISHWNVYKRNVSSPFTRCPYEFTI